MRNHLLILALSTATLTACTGGSTGSSSSESSESISSNQTVSSSSLATSSSASTTSSEAIESSASSDATSSSAANSSSDDNLSSNSSNSSNNNGGTPSSTAASSSSVIVVWPSSSSEAAPSSAASLSSAASSIKNDSSSVSSQASSAQSSAENSSSLQDSSSSQNSSAPASQSSSSQQEASSESSTQSESSSSSIGASSSERDSSSESSSVDSSSISSSASSESSESSTASSSSEVTSSSSSSSESSSSTQSSSSSPYDTVGNITIHSAEAYAFIDEDTRLEVIASGFEWAEGPVWSAAGGFLLFSDVQENTAYKWHPQEGLSRFLRPSGSTGLHFGDGSQGSNGMAINAMDELIIAQTGDRRVSKMAASLDAPDEVYETLVDNFEGDRLNAPNDLTIASSGDIYFTDPTYGLPSGNQELRHQGVYRLDTAGEIKLVIDDHNQPNGIGLSPAEDILYVTDHQLYAYDLASDASASNRRRVITNTSPYEEPSDAGGFDGLHIHSNGTIFTSGPGGIWIVDPSGEVLAVLRTGERTANCTLSDDEKTLYITADMLLIRVKLK